MHTITLHELTLTHSRPIIGGGRLFRARDDLGHLRLHDGEQFRGHATPWGRKLWQAAAWAGEGLERRDFRRTTFKTQRGAERALIREGLKLAGAL